MIKEEMCRVENQAGRKMATRRWKSLGIKPKAQQKWKSQLCFKVSILTSQMWISMS